MATFNLRKFSEPDRLKTIKPARLIAFLRPYDDYLSRRGLRLPASSDDDIDYESLANILIHPDDSVPRQMVDALYFVHEMAADEQMDELLEAAKQHQLPLEPPHQRHEPEDQQLEEPPLPGTHGENRGPLHQEHDTFDAQAHRH